MRRERLIDTDLNARKNEQLSDADSSREHKFRLGLLAFAAIFLFNPDFAVLDVLPDIVAYLLITVALKRFADINDKMEEARKRFLLMIYVSGAKLISLLLLFGVTDDYMRPYSLLLYPCVFGVVELILLVPAYKNLFEGITYLSTRNGGTRAFFYLYPIKSNRIRKVRRDAKNLTERTSSFTLFFVVSKTVLSALPEFSVLTSDTYDETGNTIDLYDYIGLFRFVAVTVMLVIGTVWLVKFIRYVCFIKKDNALYKGLDLKYKNEIETNKGLFTVRRFGLAFTFLKLAAFFLIDFYVSYNNILPDCIYAVFAIVALLLLSPYVNVKKRNIAIGVTVAYGAVSLAASLINYNFNKLHAVFEAVFKSEEAYDHYMRMCTSTLLENILFFAAIFALCAVLYDIITGHCGYISKLDNNEFADSQHLVLCRELKGMLTRVCVFSAIAAVTAVVYDFLKQYQTKHTFLSQEFIKAHPRLSTFLRDTVPSGFWFLDFVISAFAVGFIYSAINEIFYQIKQRYLY
ncbi:MAG: hypothetical protein IKA82_02885 [Clostridia bacterium]|nr:hypothetical protein [Clostridia bacterium]